MQPLERDIQKAILQYLQLKGYFVWRNNSGNVFSEHKGKQRMIKIGLPGSADILGIDHLKAPGRFIAIEVKRPRQKPTAAQVAFLTAIDEAGGLAIVAHSLEEVQRLL